MEATSIVRRIQQVLLSLLQLMSWATDKLLEFMFPQVVINRRWPAEAYVAEEVVRPKLSRRILDSLSPARKKPEGEELVKQVFVRKWRWIHSPLTKDQLAYMDKMFWEYWLRWLIAWPIVMALAAKLDSGLASGIVLMWLFLAGWTFTGMIKARAQSNRALKKALLDGWEDR